jgi:hypothetical protein
MLPLPHSITIIKTATDDLLDHLFAACTYQWHSLTSFFASQDSALMRPGRLDKLLYVGPPDKAGRAEILRIRTRKMQVDPELDLDVLSELVSEIYTMIPGPVRWLLFMDDDAATDSLFAKQAYCLDLIKPSDCHSRLIH